MANDLNKCFFIGRLGKDPELKALPNGTAVANFSIALGESWKDKQTGNEEKRTTWVNLVAFGRLAEVINTWLKKGSQAHFECKVRVRDWEDKETGQKRYATEFIVNDMQMLGKSDSQQNGYTTSAPQSANANPQPQPTNDFVDDSVPF